MIRGRMLAFTVFASCWLPLTACADVWVADRAHSSIAFRTRHWGIVDVIGWFENFEIFVLMNDRNFAGATVSARMAPASVRMPNPGMADNLRGVFGIEEYPIIAFESNQVDSVSPDDYVLLGEMTIRGVTKVLEWRVQVNGGQNFPGPMPGFTATAQLRLSDFGFGDLGMLPGTQQLVVGDVVHVSCNVRLEYHHVEKVPAFTGGPPTLDANEK